MKTAKEKRYHVWQNLPLFIVISLFITPAFGQPWQRVWHPFLTIGGGLSQSPSLGSSKIFINSDTGPNIYSNTSNGIRGAGAVDAFAGIEWTLHPCWSFQLGLGYNQTSSFPVTGSWVQNINASSVISIPYNYNIIVRQYLGEVKLLINFGPYHPYIEAGAGISQNDAYNFNTILPAKFFVNGSTSSFTYNAGVGIDMSVLCHVRIGLGYRFGNFGRVKLGNQVSILSDPVKGTLIQSPFYVHEGIISFTFI